MIEVKNLSKYYGDFKALDNLSFSISKGEIIGLLGPNGAGKTTTMRILTGFMSHDEGSVLVNEIDPEKEPLKAKKILGYVPENPLLYDELTVKEYLSFVARIKQAEDPDMEVTRVMEKAALKDRENQIIQSLSRGFKQRVGLAAALIGDPPVLILDEPTSGLDPNQVIEIRKMILEMKKEKTIILSTHILPEVEEICERVILIDRGTIKAIDTVDGLKTMFAGSPMVFLKVVDKAGAMHVLKGLDYVKAVEEREDKLEVFISALDRRTELVRALANCGLYEIFTPGVSLESVFHQLTIKEEVSA